MEYIEDPNSGAQVQDLSNQASVIYRGWYNTDNPQWATDTTATRKGEAKWKIQRITIADGVYTYEWAGGNENYNKIWDNRASLTYGFTE